jgi:hypothetical protein
MMAAEILSPDMVHQMNRGNLAPNHLRLISDSPLGRQERPLSSCSLMNNQLGSGSLTHHTCLPNLHLVPNV